MTRINCEAVREDVYEWALGALPAADERALDTHLESCDDCRAIGDKARDMAASLGFAVPLRGASATLKSRVMASAAVLSDIGERRRVRLWPAAVAALVVAGIGATAWGVITQSRMDDLEGRNATLIAGATAQAQEFGQVQAHLSQTVETQDAILEIVLEPDAQRTEMLGTVLAPEANGRCVWSRLRESGALIVEGLPPTPDGSVYVMWIVYEREWVDAGRFTVAADGEGHLLMDQWGRSGDNDWGAFEGFTVTLEPASGSDAVLGEAMMQSVRAQ